MPRLNEDNGARITLGIGLFTFFATFLSVLIAKFATSCDEGVERNMVQQGLCDMDFYTMSVLSIAASLVTGCGSNCFILSYLIHTGIYDNPQPSEVLPLTDSYVAPRNYGTTSMSSSMTSYDPELGNSQIAATTREIPVDLDALDDVELEGSQYSM